MSGRFDDFRVDPRRDLELREIAKSTRKYFGVETSDRVDVLKCVSSPKIQTVSGERRLEFQVVSDQLMKGSAGRTTYDGKIIKIEIAATTKRHAVLGDGFSRNTIVHELGHAVLHYDYLIHGAIAHRSIEATKPQGWIKPFESAEHQAKIFAAAFLINDDVALSLKSANEISISCGVSVESAKIYIRRRDEEDSRNYTAERIRKKAYEAKQILSPKTNGLQFMEAACTECGRHSVFKVGAKYMCQSCDAVYDKF